MPITVALSGAAYSATACGASDGPVRRPPQYQPRFLGLGSLYLLDVQNDLLDPLATRVVVPLIKTEEMPKPAKRLNPRFMVENSAVVMSTAELAGIPARARRESGFPRGAARRNHGGAGVEPVGFSFHFLSQ